MTARSGSPPQTGHVPRTHAGQVDARDDGVGRAREDRPHRLQQHRLQPFDFRRHAGPETRRFVPGADDEGEPLGVAGDDVDLAEIGGLERFVRAHRSGRRPHEEADVAPVDLEMLETEERPGGEQARQIVAVQPNRWKGYPSLDAPLQLQQLDLQIDGRGEVRLFVFQAPELDYFSGFGARLLSFGHAGIVSAGRLVR